MAPPASENSFKVNERSPRLEQGLKEEFHTCTAKALFLCKRARPDVQPVVSFPCTRVKEPTPDDWNKLVRLMKHLKQTREDCLTLKADGTNALKWHADAAFAVHPDMKSHTGVTMTMGKGSIQSTSKKQKLNSGSSTEAELIATDDAVRPMSWTKQFPEAQGHETNSTLHQDNKSAIQLEKNGRASAGKRSRHLNIGHFHITDQVEKGITSIKHCPTGEMVADHVTKPLHGKKFEQFRWTIMGFD